LLAREGEIVFDEALEKGTFEREYLRKRSEWIIIDSAVTRSIVAGEIGSSIENGGMFPIRRITSTLAVRSGSLRYSWSAGI